MFIKLIPRRKNATTILFYGTQAVNKSKQYADTIFLPKTKFPLRLQAKKIQERDELISSIAEFDKLYKWQRSYLSEPEFVLHDGPPYANGKLHMGHALNKVLKDVILRYQVLKGNKVHYVPGWDCHGLPIELKALSNFDAEPMEVRSKAKKFAKDTISEQMEGFKSWGIIGDWNKFYATYNPDYVKVQLKLFHKLFLKKLVYTDIKPIYWSPSTRTALAEAELQYNEHHKSPSVFVRLKVKNLPYNEINNRVYALVWTTTPWTLPANQTVCYNPSFSYSIVKSSNDEFLYIIATEALNTLSETLNCNFEIIDSLPAAILSDCIYIHPIYKEKELKFLPSTHVTSSKGTGLVHTAPAHGPEDFLVAKKHNIQIENMVNELGRFNSDAGKDLDGKFVLEEGTEKVLEMIKSDVVHLHEYEHSYPYDWRTNKPIIIRASKQWFLDTNSVKTRAVELLEDVQIIPNSKSDIYKRQLIDQIQKRPYWCISRQRKWGVPIPVLFDRRNDDAVIDEDLIQYYCTLLDKYGTDFWWKLTIEQLIREDDKKRIGLEHLEKGQDILDIWFDSGISWANALEGDKVADMYLEGVDQFTGWFQSSLLTSVALRDKAPYKTIYVHGFVVDEKGVKMSKSIGNVVDPISIVKEYGVDTLRWWVACHANQDSIAYISKNVLLACADELQKIRSVMRFALGSLSDYQREPIVHENLSLLDRYMLHLLHNFYEQTQVSIKNYQFQQICKSVINLLTTPVSALYYNAVKDRLYCDKLDSSSRKSSQYVLLQIFEIITQAVAPIVPHLVEEMYQHLPQKCNKSYFTAVHSKSENFWKCKNTDEVMNVMLNVKKDFNKEVGAATRDSALRIVFSKNLQKVIEEVTTARNIKVELEDICQVSEVLVTYNDIQEDYTLEVSKSKNVTCARCRRVQSRHEDELCDRCNEVIRTLDKRTLAAN